MRDRTGQVSIGFGDGSTVVPPGQRGIAAPLRLKEGVKARRCLLSVATALVAVTVVVGCGSSRSTASTANKAKFCQDLTSLSKATGGSPTPAHLLQILKASQRTITDLDKTAPSAIKADTQTVVNAANASIKANSIGPMSVASVQATGDQVNAYCGLNPDGTPITAGS
jgi:hypothetical protein